MQSVIIRKKLLVVEDCVSDIFLLERMLCNSSDDDLEIIGAPRLIDAFQHIDDEYFDAILLDLNLLDMDGIASVAALAAQAPDTPILVYSGMDSRPLREGALLCGAKAYLVKGQEDGRSLRRAIDEAITSRLPPPLHASEEIRP
ncbi:MAG: response regulator transcription factor [Pseudomonadota bacterium]|nr:response regulator transcription factor [Pseudomonadota bacterium]